MREGSETNVDSDLLLFSQFVTQLNTYVYHIVPNTSPGGNVKTFTGLLFRSQVIVIEPSAV